jgi:hypothetical protein
VDAPLLTSGSVSDAPTEHGPDQGIMVIDGLVRAGFSQPPIPGTRR